MDPHLSRFMWLLLGHFTPYLSWDNSMEPWEASFLSMQGISQQESWTYWMAMTHDMAILIVFNAVRPWNMSRMHPRTSTQHWEWLFPSTLRLKFPSFSSFVRSLIRVFLSSFEVWFRHILLLEYIRSSPLFFLCAFCTLKRGSVINHQWN